MRRTLIITAVATGASLSTMAFAQYAPNAGPPGVTINGRGNPTANASGSLANNPAQGTASMQHKRRHVSKRTRMHHTTTGQGSEQNPPLGAQKPPAATGSWQGPNKASQTKTPGQ